MNIEVEEKISIYLDELIDRYPILKECKLDIFMTYEYIKNSYINRGKLLVAGNGGSASDSEHIVGELMKSFRLHRTVPKNIIQKMCEIDNIRGKELSMSLESGLAAISLVSHTALNSAFLNDVGANGIFAQQVLGYGKLDDVFLGITTSGNSENIINAAIVAKALGLKVIGLTGSGGGLLKKYSDICISVPEKETYKVQELHLPIYHSICLMLEEYFFGAK